MRQDRWSGIGRHVRSVKTGATLRTWNVDVREKWDLQDLALTVPDDEYREPRDGGTVIRPYLNRDVVPYWRS